MLRRDKKQRLISVVITVFILVGLLVAGPARAFVLSVGLDSTQLDGNNAIAEGESLLFNVSLELTTDERIDITDMYVNISSDNTSYVCHFGVDGSLGVCNSSFNSITLLTVAPGYDYGNYSGYGYSPSGASLAYTAVNTGYGYGYGYSYNAVNDTLLYSLNWTVPSYNSSLNNTYKIVFSVNVSGQLFVNNYEASAATFNVKVANGSPVLNVSNTNILYNSSGLSQNISVTDVDNATSELTFYVNDTRLNFTGQTLQNDSNITGAGNFTVVINVTDGSNWDSETYNLIETPDGYTNSAPIITGYTPANTSFSIKEENSTTFNISFSDVDGNSTVNVSWYDNGNLTQNTLFANYTFVGNFTDAGSNAGLHNITVRINDSVATDEQSWLLLVNRTRDTDGDNVPDYRDVFPLNSSAWNSSQGNTSDIDNDGTPDVNQTVIGNESHIDTDSGINITYNWTNTTSNMTFTFEKTVNSTNNQTIIEIVFDDNNYTGLRMFDIFYHEGINATTNTSYVFVGGFNHSINLTKTMYLSKSNVSINGICIYNATMYNINQFSSDCSGDDEYEVECDGTSQSGTTCTYNSTSGYYKIEDLPHTGIRQVSYAKPTPNGPSGGGSNSPSGGGAPWSVRAYCGNDRCELSYENHTSCPEDCEAPPETELNTSVSAPPATTGKTVWVPESTPEDPSGEDEPRGTNTNWIVIGIIAFLVVAALAGGAYYKLMPVLAKKEKEVVKEPKKLTGLKTDSVSNKAVVFDTSMYKKELQTYIASESAKGKTKEEIRTKLLELHWPSYIVDYVFVAAEYPVESLHNLHSFVNKEFRKGISEEQVFESLIKAGWKKDIVVLMVVYERDFLGYDVESLENYVRKQLHAGFTKDKIKDKLINSHWSREYIDAVLLKK